MSEIMCIVEDDNSRDVTLPPEARLAQPGTRLNEAGDVDYYGTVRVPVMPQPVSLARPADSKPAMPDPLITLI